MGIDFVAIRRVRQGFFIGAVERCATSLRYAYVSMQSGSGGRHAYGRFILSVTWPSEYGDHWQPLATFDHARARAQFYKNFNDS